MVPVSDEGQRGPLIPDHGTLHDVAEGSVDGR